MLNKNIPNNGMKGAYTSCEGLSPGSLEMQGQASGSCNQATPNKPPLNAEWEDLFGNSMEIESFNGFSCESSNEDDIHINFNNKERQTWTKTLNTAVIAFYFLSRSVDEEGKPVTGFRRRMHNIQKEQYGMEIMEQHLCDQAKMIKKREWITKLELECTSKRKRYRSIQ